MIPWDQVPMDELKEMEAQPGDAQKIIDRLKEMKLVVALGLRGNYLLCSIGSSLECLEKLGQGKRLMDRAELKPLEKYADQRLVSVGYMSQAMGRQLNNQEKTARRPAGGWRTNCCRPRTSTTSKRGGSATTSKR